MGLIRKFTSANPHLRIALIVAPLLAVGGYIAAGLLGGAEPAGKTPTDRALRVDAACALLGGVCRLLHREIAVNLGAVEKGGATLVYLRASVPIEGALLAKDAAAPLSMAPRQDRQRWQLRLPYPLAEGDRLRLALSADGRHYYAEIPVRAATGR